MSDESKLSLLQRLNAIQGEASYIQKEKKAGMRYSIVTHDAVTAKIRPLMVQHRVLYYPIKIEMDQVGNRTEICMLVRFVNVDDANDFIDVATGGYGLDESDKGPGKAISYSVKYALLKALGLETGDDPDEDQDSTFRQTNYPDPPRRKSGLPEKGWRKDGARTAYSLRQSADWAEFEREVLECETTSMLTKLAFEWSQKTHVERWPQEWREEARQYINDRKEWLKHNAPDDDTFPGDKP